MASWTPLSTYDPDWQARWDRCHAALTASRAEQRVQDWACDAELDARCSRELDELNDAYHSRFQTVEEYRDHVMAFDVGFARGLDVPLPHFPDGASLQEVNALLSRFWADTQDARRERHRPQAADPPNLMAFTTPPQVGCERVIEEFFLPRSWEGGPVDCLLIMEATPKIVHVCFVSRRDGGSVPNNIERLANEIYRSRFEPRGRWQRVRDFFGIVKPGTYRPEALVFYDYLPWNLGGTNLCKEDFSSVTLTWHGELGFRDPKWQSFPSTPALIAEAARRQPRQLQARQQRALSSSPTERVSV